MILQPRKQMTVRQEGERVLLIVEGRAILDVDWQGALAIAQGLQIQGKKAEEVAKAEEVIFDGAILARSGAPFGISANPDIQEEVRKEAAWNSDLRKAMPEPESYGTLYPFRVTKEES